MLSSLTWPSLEDRRKAAQLILLFKILRKLFVVPDRCLPILTPLHSTQAHHPLKLAHIQSRIDVYKYSFLPRTIRNWNNLYMQDIDKIDLTTFENNLTMLL